jgi:hypothetical protein
MKPRHQKRAFVRTEVKLLPKSNLLRDIFIFRLSALLRSRSVGSVNSKTDESNCRKIDCSAECATLAHYLRFEMKSQGRTREVHDGRRTDGG